MRKVMVFGVFDGVHDGHRDFLRQAKALGDYLIAVVAPDTQVYELKGRHPASAVEERMEELYREDHVDRVIRGDDEMGSWRVVRRWKPDVIAAGYDQDDLRHALEMELGHFSWHAEIETLAPHKPEQYKSSALSVKRVSGF